MRLLKLQNILHGSNMQRVSDLQQVGGFLCVLRFPPPIKLTTRIKLKYS